jgi:hypothetical protein
VPQGRENNHRRFGFEYLLESGQHFLAELLEFRAAMIDGCVIDRAQDAVGHIGRAGDLQEMASARHGYFLVFSSTKTNLQISHHVRTWRTLGTSSNFRSPVLSSCSSRDIVS